MLKTFNHGKDSRNDCSTLTKPLFSLQGSQILIETIKLSFKSGIAK